MSVIFLINNLALFSETKHKDRISISITYYTYAIMNSKYHINNLNLKM